MPRFANLPPLAARTRALLARAPVFDAHVDALQRALDLGHDLGRRTPGQFDLVRARAGGLGAVVLVSWVDAPFAGNGARARAEALMEEGRRLAARHPERLVLVGNGEELDSAQSCGRIAGILGIEGGHALEDSVEVLDALFERGLRVVTLVWNNHLSWIRSCQDGAGPEVPLGLSALGRRIVARMGELGVLVDLSHAGERAFFETLDVAPRPVMASHSGCRALHDHPRNLTDAQLRALGERDGLVGIVFHPGFLDADARAEEARVRGTPCYLAARGAGDTARFLKQSALMQAKAAPLHLDRLVDHVLHALDVAGPRAVGIGSDFDGIQRGPAGLEDAARYGRLAERLLERGVDEATVLGVLGDNLRRVFTAATGPGTAAHARSFAREL
ncbi:MAG: hypothetical protein GC161_16590 [Planctomycetaceae bacterium]|nr:hypothetical protein [Planctomycetaceae bacterium]